MRIRSIKPEFWISESVGRLSREARLLFIGLWSCCDDSGRARSASRLLASLLFPYDEDAIRLLPKWLNELSAAGMIREYTVNGDSYLDIPKWSLHQKIDKPSQSKLPQFVEDSRGLVEDSRGLVVGTGSGTGNREQGTGSELSLDALSICELLKSRILTNDPKAKTPDAFTSDKGWGAAARLLLDSDRRSIEEARAVIEWSSANDFWKSNILSMGKLREKYTTLLLQMKERSDARINKPVTPAYNTGVLSREPPDKFKGR